MITQEDLQKIYDYLKNNGVKDSTFPVVTGLSSKDIIPIIRNGENKLIKGQDVMDACTPIKPPVTDLDPIIVNSGPKILRFNAVTDTPIDSIQNSYEGVVSDSEIYFSTQEYMFLLRRDFHGSKIYYRKWKGSEDYQDKDGNIIEGNFLINGRGGLSLSDDPALILGGYQLLENLVNDLSSNLDTVDADVQDIKSIITPSIFYTDDQSTDPITIDVSDGKNQIIIDSGARDVCLTGYDPRRVYTLFFYRPSQVIFTVKDSSEQSIFLNEINRKESYSISTVLQADLKQVSGSDDGVVVMTLYNNYGSKGEDEFLQIYVALQALPFGYQ